MSLNDERIIILDPLLGCLVFHDKEAKLINTAEMARLRYIHQLATIYLFYPSALHTRFLHSVGVASIVKRFIDNLPLKWYKMVSPGDKFHIVAAALLHDVGHSAWGHAGELFAKFRGFDIRHAQVSAELVRGNNRYDKYFKEWNLPRIRDILSNKEDREIIAKLIEGKSPIPEKLHEPLPDEMKEKLEREKRFLGQMINSVNDLDRAEYLMRDAFYTGIMLGYGPQCIFEKIGIEEVKGANQLVFLDQTFAESFILNRELMYAAIYTDSRDLIAREMLARAWDRIFPTVNDVYELWFSTDYQILERMRTSNDKFAQKIAHLLQSCKIYPIIEEIKFNDPRLDENIISNLKELDQNRFRLLTFEEELAKEVGISRDNLIIGIRVFSKPVEVEALTKTKEGIKCIEAISPLISSISQSAYVNGRSKLVVAGYEISPAKGKEIIEKLFEKLRKY